jgi:hypothetical protein
MTIKGPQWLQHISILLVTIAAIVLLQLPVHAQTDQGRITGTVTDANGALWERAWGNDKPLNTESLHVYIYRLRNKLMPYKLRIDTMVNVGYRLMLDRQAGG